MKQVLTLFTSLALLVTFTKTIFAMEKEVDKDQELNIVISKKTFDEIKQKYATQCDQNGLMRPSIDFNGDAELLVETLRIFPNIKEIRVIKNESILSLFKNISKVPCSIHRLQLADTARKAPPIQPEYMEGFSHLITFSLTYLKMSIMTGRAKLKTWRWEQIKQPTHHAR